MRAVEHNRACAFRTGHEDGSDGGHDGSDGNDGEAGSDDGSDDSDGPFADVDMRGLHAIAYIVTIYVGMASVGMNIWLWGVPGVYKRGMRAHTARHPVQAPKLDTDTLDTLCWTELRTSS